MIEAINRHERIALQFSGGKDSLACLHLLRDNWHKIIVCWVNTGDAFPETLEQMRQIRNMVPHFREIRSDQRAQITATGWPVEVVPVTRTPLGRAFDGHNKQIMQPYSMCCGANIWEPLRLAMVGMGVTLIIRGTRISDPRKSSVRSGDVIDGVEYLHPIEGWSSDQVKAYLRDHGVELPGHYAYVNTSLDCRMCTAFLHENVGKMRYMREKHPADYQEIISRIREIHDATASEMRHIQAALEA